MEDSARLLMVPIRLAPCRVEPRIPVRLFALPKKYAHPITNDLLAPATFVTLGT
jgi:hypothetical protein